MKILAVGDVVGKPGRFVLKDTINEIREKYKIDAVVVNAENAAHGNGITLKIAQEIFGMRVNTITMGNHTWAKKEICDFIGRESRIIRPANYPKGTPGKGSTVFKFNDVRIGVINLMGRVCLEPLDSPFFAADREIENLKDEADIILVDFHAEATSEKIALGWYLDGRVSAVWGTHTHVQTADNRVLPNGTGYITDLGMTGCIDGVLGVKKEIILDKFLKQMPVRFDLEEKGQIQLNAAVFEIDENTKKCNKVERINTSIYE